MIGTNVHQAADLLKKGKLVAIPTETVYGLAANALNETAVLSIFKAKERPFFDPLIVHIWSLKQLSDLTISFPEKAQILADKYWPGPLTLILQKSELVPDLVTSGLPMVGIRMPRHPMTQQLLSLLDFPLAAPSANPFGYVSPTNAAHVMDQLEGRIDYILDGGQSPVGVESTIVSFAEANRPVVLRYGGISMEEIEDSIGTVEVEINSGNRPNAPGQLDKHYATAKTLEIAELSDFEGIADLDNFVIGFGPDSFSAFDFNLSEKSDLNEAASNLFSALRLADASTKHSILAFKVSDIGIGRAINDRLKRAAAG